MRKILITFLLFGSFSLFSESVYQIDYKKDLILGSTSLALFVPTLFLEADASEISVDPQINSLDKNWTRSYDRTMDEISTYTAYATLLLPGISLIEQRRDYSAILTYGVMYTEAFLLTTGSKDLLKYMVTRNRPYTAYDGIPRGEEDDYFNSFPSGHTAYAFMGATFLCTTFSQEFPESKWKIPVISGSYALAATVAYMRIESGNHFITDVLAGAAIGTFYGWFVPQMHLRPGNEESADVSIVPIPKGILIGLSF